MKLPVYLDYHATTPMDPRVLDTILPFYREDFGNSHSSTHAYGWRAEQAIETSREQVAKCIGASGSEIIFTSGATESNNLALFGVANAYKERGKHIISCATEHKSILDSLQQLTKSGFIVTILPVDEYGKISLNDLRKAIRKETILISIMAANNEIGTLQPIREIGAIAKNNNILFHCDAVQAIGKCDISVDTDQIDLLSLSGHKIYGPKGVGALYVRKKNPRVELQPIIFGGGHERGLRSGTLNTPGIVGLASALQICMKEKDSDAIRISALRNSLLQKLKQEIPDLLLNGHPEDRLYNNLNISIPHIVGDLLLVSLKDIAVSSGSACNSASNSGSYVLNAIGRNADLARASLRFGLGRFTTQEDIDFAAQLVYTTVKRLREKSQSFQLRS